MSSLQTLAIQGRCGLSNEISSRLLQIVEGREEEPQRPLSEPQDVLNTAIFA